MSLDVTLHIPPCADAQQHPLEDEERKVVYEANITHNLNKMAKAAGLYEALWHPERAVTTSQVEAKSLIPLLRAGLLRLQALPEKYRAFDASNGWGTHKDLVLFTKEYLAACEINPSAIVTVSR